MTTFKQLISEYCSNKTMGIMEDDLIAEVVNKAANDPSLEPMKGRFNDDINDYPKHMSSLVLMIIDDVVLSVIDENCPNAFFRPLFDKNHELNS